MKKGIALILCLAWLLAPAALASEGEGALPDPGLSFFAAGKLLEEGRLVDGIAYDVYGYTYEKEASKSLTSTLTAYQWKAQAAGFDWEVLKDKTTNDGIRGDDWFAISSGGLTAQLCVTGSYAGTSCTATLYVPQGMAFALEKEVGSRTSFQNDLYLDADSLWTQEKSPTGVVCASCHGSGRCAQCGGTGVWKNPYTGDRRNCDCDGGVCAVCDGSGYWS